MKMIRKLASRTALISEQPASLLIGQFLENLCTAIRRANARAVLRRRQVIGDSLHVAVAAADVIAADVV